MTTTTSPRRSRLSVRTSILGVGAAGMAAALVVGGFALGGLQSAGEARAEVAELNDALGRVQEMKYFNADVSG